MSPIAYEVNPVPPYATPIVVAFHVPAVTVPSPVIPVYEPLMYAEPTVPEVIWLPSIAMAVDAAKVNWPWALTVNVPTDDAEPYAPAVTAVLVMLNCVPARVNPVPAV